MFWGVKFILKITDIVKNNHLGYKMAHFNLIFGKLEHSDMIFILIIAFENRKICREHAFLFKPYIHDVVLQIFNW